MNEDRKNIFQDCLLDPDISFNNIKIKNNLVNENILLTGSTGLLGAYLLSDLLKYTNANIFCIVRCKNEIEGFEKIKNNLNFYQLLQNNISLNKRITVLKGDLSKPFIGLSQTHFDNLSECIDVIYHNGCFVNFISPYSLLKKTNVFGTQNIIRLAATKYLKTINYISSVIIFFSEPYFNKGKVFENETPQYDDTLQGGYKISKWVSEKLIIKARESGVPVIIYRPTRIFGSIDTGIIPIEDALCHIVRTCIDMKMYPSLNTYMDFTPVDFLSKAIVNLSLRKKSLNKIFHLSNPVPISFKNFFKEISKCGYDLNETEYAFWISELKNMAKKNPDNKSYSYMIPFLEDNFNLIKRIMKFDSENALEAISELKLTYPEVNIKLIKTYMNYFKNQGII